MKRFLLFALATTFSASSPLSAQLSADETAALAVADAALEAISAEDMAAFTDLMRVWWLDLLHAVQQRAEREARRV